MELEEPETNVGAQMIREAAERTGEAVGDGTSTSSILAHAIFAEGLHNMRAGKGNHGFDASRCEYVDLVEAGIIDPTKVVRVALENAVSVASVLLLAEATLTELPEGRKKAAAAHESFE